MTATATMYVYTGATAATEAASTYLSLMSTDAADSGGTDYQSNKITIPTSGNDYSYERWFRVKFTDTFNEIENCKFYLSAGAATGTGWAITANYSDSAVTPIDTNSTIATSNIPTVVGSAIAIQNGTMTSADDYTKYAVMQLDVDDTAGPGDITTGTVTVQYDES